jgi:hypothetical protein
MKYAYDHNGDLNLEERKGVHRQPYLAILRAEETVTVACNGQEMWGDGKYIGLENICGKIMKSPPQRSGRRWQECGRCV